MESITALNNGMIKFPGAAMFTSQDHQFIQTIANRIMEILPGGLIDKVSTYDEYLESDVMANRITSYNVCYTKLLRRFIRIDSVKTGKMGGSHE